MIRLRHLFSIVSLGLLFACSTTAPNAVNLANTNSPEDFLALPDGTFLLQNARIIDGMGSAAKPDLDIRIEDGLIAAIGPELPTEGVQTVLDLDGATVMPGLVHVHDHIIYLSSPFRGYEFLLVDPHPFSIPKLYLSAGVTTVRSPGTDAPDLDIQLARMIADGQAVGPKIYVTGNFINGPDVPMMRGAITEDDGRAFVKSQAALGVGGVKVYSDLGAEALKGVIDEAADLGLWVAGDLGYGASCAEAARLGIDTIEHGFNSCLQDLPALNKTDRPFKVEDHLQAIEDLIGVLVEEETVLVATPSGGAEANFSNEVRSMFAPFMRDAFDAVRVEDGERSESGNPMYTLYMRDQIAQMHRMFVDAGGTLLIGADAMYIPLVPGYANHDIMIDTANYFPAMDVIRMATSDAAEFLGVGDQIGRVEVGYTADLLVVPGNPDEDMKALRELSLVFRQGRAYDPMKLKQGAMGRIGLD
ncbi:MAG: amidohydrolase family protein [Pseudomonadota bacterium]